MTADHDLRVVELPDDGFNDRSGRVRFDGTTLTIETDCHGCYAETSDPKLIEQLRRLLSSG